MASKLRPPKAARVDALGLPEGSPIPRHLAEDPDFPAQPFCNMEQDFSPQPWSEFSAFAERAPVLPSRRTLVLTPMGWDGVALPPGWPAGPAPPPLSSFADFLGAFTGLATRLLLPGFPIGKWGASKGKAAAAAASVRSSKSLVKVRVRAAPDGDTPRQLHCWDLLDALLEDLPADAFAIVGVTLEDIYEQDEDDADGATVCGRAFGGSRICVLSLARYAPRFVDAAPEWPGGAARGRKGVGGPLLAAARAAAAAAPGGGPTAQWLARAAPTAAHEVGHCIGLDHCTYYSCFMGEEEGQAPYACPVCLRKMLWAVAGGGSGGGGAAVADDAAAVAAVAHYAAVEAFCGAPGRAAEPLWASWRVWAAGRRAALEAGGGGGGGGGGAAHEVGGGEAPPAAGHKRARAGGSAGGRWEFPF
jgi:predicted Zn-dependent protease